jgi:hypothetical protein
MRWAAHLAHMGEKRKIYKVFAGKPEVKDTTWKAEE